MRHRVDLEEQRVRAVVREAMRDLMLYGTPDEQVADAAQSTSHPSEYTFASYIEGNLSSTAEENFERHVAFCPNCAQELVLARRAGVGREERSTHRVWKIAASIALIFGGLISALLGARTVGERLETAAIERFESALGGKAKVESVALTFEGGPGVELSGLVVNDPQGSEPLLTSASAQFTVDIGALMRGDLEGVLQLDQPVINIVRDASGRVNIDALLPRSVGAEDIFAIASERAVHRVQIAGGTVRVIDRAGATPREIRMASVDAELRGFGEGTPVHLDAKAGFESTKHNVSVSGDVGPWGRGETPNYKLDRVALSSVPLRAFPAVGAVMGGGLSFDGKLATAGETWNEITGRVSGSGEMSIVSGAIAGHNFVADVVGPLLGDQEPPSRLGGLFTATSTSFDEIRSPVTLAESRLHANELHLAGNGYEVLGKGSIDLNGTVAFTGHLRVSPEVTREVIALAPLAGALVTERGEISVPFSVSGTWPDVQTTVDVERFAKESVLRRWLAWAWFKLPRPLLG
ncbi:MAG TPA: AsmA-like C-terminal region-containing protein [Candidatus Binatia bacterium]